ncbi:hypothetical protein GUJ93_ZPchr0002g26609 [Zizania palustris]|uniref:RRM domain-containing protein n=1 Tax=Zizania palustris TaxID=103762 RepID=A0A8J5VU08_ZIZPA|nr:hypothetical protein GUJ93_ZPchr0002g26609 [Zizania palustris]
MPPLFSKVKEMPLLFRYLPSCHYNFQILAFMSFSTCAPATGPPADVDFFCIAQTTSIQAELSPPVSLPPMAATLFSTALSPLLLPLSSSSRPAPSVSFPSKQPPPLLCAAAVSAWRRSPFMLVPVAASSEVKTVEAEEFSEDLRVFIGNMPFTVDSAQLAGLFEQAGSVEMVEVCAGTDLHIV